MIDDPLSGAITQISRRWREQDAEAPGLPIWRIWNKRR